MLWRNINFWRVAALALFAAVLVLAFPHLKADPSFVLESSNMEIVTEPEYGAKFTFSVSNDGRSGDAYVTCRAYLYQRGGEMEEDYTVMGINSGETDSGELFMPLRPGQTVHDWLVVVE